MKEFGIGGIAGAAGIVAGHPIDTLKVQLGRMCGDIEYRD